MVLIQGFNNTDIVCLNIYILPARLQEDGLGVYSVWQSYEVNIVYVPEDQHMVGHPILKLPAILNGDGKEYFLWGQLQDFQRKIPSQDHWQV